MPSHRLHPRVVATVLVALCVAVCVAPTAFASGNSDDAIIGYRYASPDRSMQSPGGSVVGLRLIPEAHATVQPDAPLDGAKASRDAGENLAAALVAIAILLVIVAPFAFTARGRRIAPAGAPATAH